MSYFLIYCSEDGDVSVTPYEKEELLEAIRTEDYGCVGFIENISELQGNGDPQMWGNNILIIKGEIVTPEPEKVIEKYKIL